MGISWSSSDYSRAIQYKNDQRQTRLTQEVEAPATSLDTDIFQSHCHEIVQNIEKGVWTSTQVVEAFISQACRAHERTNCITEVLFERARKQARELDEEFAQTKTLRGPLHGVPFSIKDQYNVEGFDSTVGFTQWTDKPASQDATLVRQLIAAGAIPLVKTNVPQTMFSFECNNPLWGRTLNPHNAKFTCGGSSGGEGAILASNGSPLGLGSDVGGSLRIPAAYCGIYSLKPGKGRVSGFGTVGMRPGFEAIPTVYGPMARSIGDLELFCRTVFGQQDIVNNELAPVPFQESIAKLPSKLKFGYYTSAGWVKSSPPVERAVLETVEALRKQGHECVEFELPNVSGALTIMLALVSSDSYRKMTSHLGPDPMDSSMWLPVYSSRLPSFLRSLIASFFNVVLGDKLFGRLLLVSGWKSAAEYVSWTAQREEFIRDFYAKVWNQHNFDGVIAPVQALPQIKHGWSAVFSSLFIDTGYYNVMDSPVGCLPVTHVDPSKDILTEEWTRPRKNLTGSQVTEDKLYRGSNPYYNVEEMAGMPVGLQIVGKRWEEEKVLSMMRVVEEALQESRDS